MSKPKPLVTDPADADLTSPFDTGAPTGDGSMGPADAAPVGDGGTPAPDTAPGLDLGRGKRNRKAPRDAAPAAPAAPKAGRPSNKQKRTDALTGLFSLIGLGLSAIPSDKAGDDAIIVLTGAPALAEAFANAAETNPALAKAIDSVIRTSAYGAIAAASMAMVIPILANHGVVPDAAVLMFPPSAVLVGQARAMAAELEASGGITGAMPPVDPQAS